MTAIKAIIDAVDNAYIIRIYGREGDLSAIHVVDEIEVGGKSLNRMNEYNGSVPDIATCRIVQEENNNGFSLP